MFWGDMLALNWLKLGSLVFGTRIMAMLILPCSFQMRLASAIVKQGGKEQVAILVRKQHCKEMLRRTQLHPNAVLLMHTLVASPVFTQQEQELAKVPSAASWIATSAVTWPNERKISGRLAG